MVPEGLVLLTSVALAVGVVRLGRRVFDLRFGSWQQTATALAVAGGAGVSLEALW
jgi:hypothetical protein